ncbi:MAG: filamentous hemagglutinin N-terminal domain-containing protein, partial [Candidatus Cloacimonetes bacterium]|nr:filamentous hemagglutinin N-terminal domain-containing protein [Candidatus Cloacimonadota bacterium]
MNHTYRLIWNRSSLSYVPAPETTKTHGKSASKKLLIPAAIVLSTSLALPAYAKTPIAQSMASNTLPQGGQVVAGQASINQAGQQMTINQGSQKAIINWNKFNIGQDASVTFQQPNSKAIALNRVITNDASQIHGQLNANGQVWLINPSGVLFGKNSQVNVGGMVASTLDIANKDFLKDNYQFKRDQATGGISNLGTLTAAAGGYIALLAPTVSNEGIITAQLGSVTLAAGDQITLNAGADGLLNVQLDPATVETLIENKQLIVADGGQVIMTGRAADALSASVVSNSGKVQANAIAEKDGRILLVADMQHGQTQAAGELSAEFVETGAAKVVLDKNLKVNTQGGEWLIDPVDIIIDSAKAQAIQTGLNSGNVTVTTADNANNPWGDNGAGSDAGDIHVNADITYTQNKLTLNADNNINLNAEINVNGSGTLALNPGGNINAKFGDNGGFAGKVNFAQSGPGLLTINSNNYTVINSLGLEGSTNGTDLQGMNGNLSGYYALGS